MSLVWYTVAELADGISIDTNDYCHLNRSALSQATRVERAVEKLLEEVRLEMAPLAPARICSILVVPWPVNVPAQGTGLIFREGAQYERIQEPPGVGTYCYRVIPGSKGVRYMADETIVDRLVMQWEELTEDEKMEAAEAYWAQEIWSSPSYLLFGEVRIVERCFDPLFVREKQRVF
jgi:hypothetical protein